MTTKHGRVKAALVRLHAEHPDWDALQLAAAVDSGVVYVAKLARELGLMLPGKRGRPPKFANSVSTTVAFEADELTRIRQAATSAGMGIGEYIRRRVLGAA